ncbi:MAG: ATP-binding protein [Armatimonadetes bacterium]|nr:ATP-binding protein [Armatimonadota bacterium]
MEPSIGTLTIERFRAFRKLTIEGLGRVNLITGRNNTGKSSVLEALRILASDASPSVLHDILRSREEYLDGAAKPGAPQLGPEGAFELSSLFHGFPSFPRPGTTLGPLAIRSDSGGHRMRVSIGTGWFAEEPGPAGTRNLVPYEQDRFLPNQAIPGLVLERESGRVEVPLGYWLSHDTISRFRLLDQIGDLRLRCVFVDPYGGERTATLARLWDKIALSGLEEDVVEALRVVEPGIKAVSMVGGEGSGRGRSAIVRADGYPRPLPLRSFGDGLNRLLGILLSLANADGGLLLIDEFENGLHHTVQTDTWRAVFRLAADLDVQVVATSHSWDAVEAFQQAASETPEEGVLIRLTRKGEDIIPTLFREEELAVATRDRIEVR